MKCKSKFCDLEAGHRGRCMRINNDAPVNPVRINFTPIDEIVAEHEKDPACKKALDEAREWVKGLKRLAAKGGLRDKEAYNAYMREYMRRRRAA